MALTHAERRTAFQLWNKLEEARDIVAGSRSSVFLPTRAVDPVTMKIVDLQDLIREAIAKDEKPEQENIFNGLYPGRD